MCAARPQLRPGDVYSVTFADPPNDKTRTGPLGRIPENDERVAVKLEGHPLTYVVKVATAKGREPRLTELTITTNNETARIDTQAMRSINPRRLAYTAAQWIERHGGQVGYVDDTAESGTQPEHHDSRVYQAAKIAERALSLGQPVRPTVAAELNVSTKTVDRLLKRAAAESWWDGKPLPKRPQPPQRDIQEDR
ncbi:hypothetical protein H7J93_13605 [Mycobacterium barrassiae]|uniref:hypothetical protein n=1 Tax=Mycobacterium barrassiae TaxID=319709 RepID=UPI002265DCEC|nr:hypothetical protein [Mycobacterium barrassiae]MCV7300666.1 hypothetical protein [Mycobacterium barrassiae]